MWGAIVAALAVVLAGVSGSGPVGTIAGGQPSGLCALQLVYDGVAYDGAPRGDPDRTPDLTGRTGTGRVSGCNDTGGEEEPAQDVTVEEIDGIPMTTAVWAMGSLLVRRGETLPASTEDWYGVPTCDLRDPVTLTGRWLGVMSEKEVRFDGDLRTPLWIDLAVEPDQGNPPELVGYTLRVHDDGGADPALEKSFAEEALWSSRSLLAVEVTCGGERFTARGFSLTE